MSTVVEKSGEAKPGKVEVGVKLRARKRSRGFR
ncbi:Uncharacterised protein [Pseudomonas aeruginosa]|nr:Uncharacterised protein [Pseudomonas aeruginosa]